MKRALAGRRGRGAVGPAQLISAKVRARNAAGGDDAAVALRAYLADLVDRYQSLETKGFGQVGRAPLDLQLSDVFIPLGARRLVGDLHTNSESSGSTDLLREPVVDLIGGSRCTVLLGGPGSGKTTLLKYLALEAARTWDDSHWLGSYVPFLVPIPALGAYAKEKNQSFSSSLREYLYERSDRLNLDEVIDVSMDSGCALVLLDGLDEVGDAYTRNVIMQALQDFINGDLESGNRYVITSRYVGYSEVRPTVRGMVEARLTEFTDDDVFSFADRWSRALSNAQWSDPATAAREAQRIRSKLVEAVRASAATRELASSPLLLTILAMLDRQAGTLPTRRVELYQQTIDILLGSWNLARNLDAKWGQRAPSSSLVTRVLAPLALEQQEAGQGLGLIPARQLREGLLAGLAEAGRADEEYVDAFLADARNYSGLLVEKGLDRFAFVHLTFQEYLAAQALIDRHQEDLEVLAVRLGQMTSDTRFVEVAKLVVGQLALIRRRPDAAARVLQVLEQASGDEPGVGLVIAGEAAAEILPDGLPLEVKNDLRHRLLRTATSEGSAAAGSTRVAAAVALSKLGDLRAEVLTVDDLEVCLVPGGAFVVDSGAGTEGRLEAAFWLARFPTTTAQYRRFVDDGGYKDRLNWTEQGWLWKSEVNADGPPPMEEAFSEANQPIVATTWHEAVAYTRWLTSYGRGLGWWDHTVEARLPTEQEWLKACRGGLEVPNATVLRPLSGLHAPSPAFTSMTTNPDPGRRYSYAEPGVPLELPTTSHGVQHPASVGCFPRTSSPYGCEDMTGNVWEWLSTRWGPTWNACAFPRQDLANDDRDSLSWFDEPRMVKGGSYLVGLEDHEGAAHLDSNYRTKNHPDVRHASHGFRICISDTRSAHE